MKKIYFKNLYSTIIASLWFSASIVLARLVGWDKIIHPVGYDAVTMGVGLLTAILFINYKMLKALFMAIILFLVYILYFRLSGTIILVSLFALASQSISMYIKKEGIKIFFICLILGVAYIITSITHGARMIFLVKVSFFMHLWLFIMVSVAIIIMPKILQNNQIFKK